MTRPCAHEGLRHHRGWARTPPTRPPLSRYSPVALPGVADVRVVNAVLIGLLVQEVKHVLDGQGQGRAAVCRAEDGLEEVVHELLQRALGQEAAQVHTQLCPGSSEVGLSKPASRIGEGRMARVQPGRPGRNRVSACVSSPAPLHLSLTALNFLCTWEIDIPRPTGPK